MADYYVVCYQCEGTGYNRFEQKGKWIGYDGTREGICHNCWGEGKVLTNDEKEDLHKSVMKDYTTPPRITTGKYTLPDKTVYTGDLVNGLPHGQGKVKWPEGDSYEGTWIKGKRHGHGKYTYEDGTVYKGEFTNEKRTGYAKETYPNGDEYEGDFVDGIPNGTGKYTYEDGEVQEGTWKDGEFVG